MRTVRWGTTATRGGALLTMLVAALGGCARSGTAPLRGAEFYYEEGMEALRRGRCVEAAEQLQRLVSNFPGSRLVPDAQYHLAEAYFCSEDYVNAVFEYQRLVDTYPASEWVDEAQFKTAECYFRQSRRAELDQSETRDALSYYRIFLDDNPDSPLAAQARERISACRQKLARKQYQAGRLYLRQEHMDAAQLYFEELLLTYPDTEYYYRALLELGEIAAARGESDVARQHWAEVARDSGSAELQQRASARLAEVFSSAGE